METEARRDTLAARICFPRLDKYVKRLGIGIPAVLDRIFNDRLQGQRRDAEEGVRRVVFNNKGVFILGLLHGEVCACMFQFRGKRFLNQ